MTTTTTHTDWATGETVEFDAVNTHINLTVADILDLDDCACGHDAEAHFEDGILEAPGVCADLGRDHQGCFCRGLRIRLEP